MRNDGHITDTHTNGVNTFYPSIFILQIALFSTIIKPITYIVNWLMH